MTVPDVAQARELFAAGQWNRCVEALVQADELRSLDGDDRAFLGEVAFLTGQDQLSTRAYGRAYTQHLEAGDRRAATRCAMACAFVLEQVPDPVQSAAWAARGRQLVAEHGLDGPEAGWAIAEEAHRIIVRGDVAEAYEQARRGEALGLQAGDPDVVVLSRLTVAFALLLQGDRPGAVRVLDEIMVAVCAEETTPVVVGLAYCSVIGACMSLRDVVRARAWTAALSRWCDARPDLAPYRGTCLVHRAQLMTLGGAWRDAAEEALLAESLLRGPSAGEAAYQLGELARLRGEVEAAEEHYRRANALGKQPEPGLSRLRVAQGRAERARTTLARLCAEPRAPEDRAELLAVRVEADLALGDVDAAQAHVTELTAIAAGLDAPLVHGLARHAAGAVLAAAGRPRDALDPLRRARRIWEDLELPYPCAQVRLLVGECLRALGDEGAAELELDAARQCFDRLGAGAGAGPSAPAPTPLTARELDVVRLVAAGHTNRAIATRLRLSEKTVARHLSNIYTKLDLPSRAAATAYAYDHGLVPAAAAQNDP